MKLLLDRGADVNAITDETVVKADDFPEHAREYVKWSARLRTALQIVARSGHVKAVKLLLDRDADVNAFAEGYFGTALQAAAHNGRVNIMKLLLNRGALPSLDQEKSKPVSLEFLDQWVANNSVEGLKEIDENIESDTNTDDGMDMDLSTDDSDLSTDDSDLSTDDDTESDLSTDSPEGL